MYIALIIILLLMLLAWWFVSMRIHESFGDRPMNMWDWIMFREQIAYRRARFNYGQPPVAELLWT